MRVNLDYCHEGEDYEPCKRCGVQDTPGQLRSYCEKPVVYTYSLTPAELSLIAAPEFMQKLDDLMSDGDLELQKYRYMIGDRNGVWAIYDLREDKWV